MNLGKMRAALRAYREGAPLGDVVMLKLDALSAPPAGLREKLAPLRGYAPEQDLAALRRMPAGTLGREYARFLEANGITPLAVSPRIKERFRDEPFPLRYTMTHDLHHLLSGFDTGLAGEIGVFAFNLGQGSAPESRFTLWVACMLYAIFAPTQARTIWHNARVGLELGKNADLVIAARLESWFEEPLGEVRERLHIADPRAAGVWSSGPSVVGRLLQRRLASQSAG